MEEKMTKGSLVAVGVLGLLFAGVSAGEDRTTPGELVADPPTIRCLSFRWYIRGDENGNCAGEMSFRKKGEKEWRKALPMLRVNRETVDREYRPFRCGNLLAGSLLYLEPGTTYEVRFRLHDPDGGEAEKVLTATTRTEPPEVKGTRQIHIYPPGYKGEKKEPSFSSLDSASKNARPGDVVLLHAGTYPGPIEFDVSGTKNNPIVFRGAGDGEVIIDGGGANANIIDAQGRKDYLYFENLTIRNGRTGIKANSSNGLVIRRCKIENVTYGIITYTTDTENWYVADNIITGQDNWHPRPSKNYGNPGIHIEGKGHIIAYNRISKFGDCISVFASRSARAKWNTMRQPPQCAIDIYNNDLSEAKDDGIEGDATLHNVRVFDNRIMNVHTGISAQPVYGGPLYIVRNLIYNATYTALKLHNYPSGLVVLHNTCFCCKQGLESWPPYWQNAFLRNNLFWGAERYAVETGSAHPLTSLDYNGYRKTGDPERFIKWSSDGGKTWTKHPTLKEFYEATGHEEHGVMFDLDSFVKVSPPRRGRTHSPEEIDPRPKPDSKIVDAGVVLPGINDNYKGPAPDLGCYEAGERIHHYGPRVKLAEARPASAISPKRMFAVLYLFETMEELEAFVSGKGGMSVRTAIAQAPSVEPIQKPAPLTGRVKLLCGFENEAELEYFVSDGGIELSQENVTQGKFSAKVFYPRGGTPRLISQDDRFTSAFGTDWSQYKMLKVDIFNNSDRAVRLKLKLKSNRHRKSCETSLHLQPKKTNRITIPLSEIGESLDLSKLMYINFYAWKPPSEFTLYFDNLRLER